MAGGTDELPFPKLMSTISSFYKNPGSIPVVGSRIGTPAILPTDIESNGTCSTVVSDPVDRNIVGKCTNARKKY
jgi:hypothetical protein